MSNVWAIDCEWDMGFADAYETKEKAEEAIKNAEWESLVDMTYEEVVNEGLVGVYEVNVC